DVDVELLDDLPYGHRHIARLGGGPRMAEAILYRKRKSLEVLTAPASAQADAPPSGGAAASSADAADAGGADRKNGGGGEGHAPSGALGMFAMGIEHILLGIDHLVFLLGLVLVGGRFRSILMVVTAFTVAHSVTLVLATLGIWNPSPSLVEPAIALSIAYVGVENFFVGDAEGRWRVTLPFGLIHGFGFAGALQEIALPRPEIPKALLFFNLGVEAGQIAVLAVVLPLLAVGRKRGWMSPRNTRLASALIVLAGVAWFVERVFGG
ncbi:MAG TPA: HupE/UreJ family protein, partial [Candidatus Nanopelagicales bacterium]|nr:HupE/UreJ family protein [Candidatus Nanopelagicales bacterium]